MLFNFVLNLGGRKRGEKGKNPHNDSARRQKEQRDRNKAFQNEIRRREEK